VIGVTADTNIYVSAIQFGGRPRDLLDLARRGEIELHISEPILTELTGVLRDKFGWQEAPLRELEQQLRRITRIVAPTQTLNVITVDEPDNRILECAAAAGSHFIVSGDNDLLRLGSYGQAPITRVADFLDLIQPPPERGRPV